VTPFRHVLMVCAKTLTFPTTLITTQIGNTTGFLGVSAP